MPGRSRNSALLVISTHVARALPGFSVVAGFKRDRLPAQVPRQAARHRFQIEQTIGDVQQQQTPGRETLAIDVAAFGGQQMQRNGIA